MYSIKNLESSFSCMMKTTIGISLTTLPPIGIFRSNIVVDEIKEFHEGILPYDKILNDRPFLIRFN